MSRTAEPEQVRLNAQRRRICSLAEAAEVHRSRARYAKAESLLRQALAMAALGSDELVIATLLNNLAVVHKYQGRFAEASRLYRRALPLLRKALGPEHLEMAAVYHNLGGLEHARAGIVGASRSHAAPWTFAKRL